MFKVTFTAERYTPESLDLGISEENGFVDLNWSRHQVSDEPKVEEFETRAEAEKHIEDSIGDTDPTGDSYYSVDHDVDVNGDTWSYAGHIEEVTAG